MAWNGELIWSNGAMTGPQFAAGGKAWKKARIWA